MRPGYPKMQETMDALSKLPKPSPEEVDIQMAASAKFIRESRETPTIKEGASWHVGVPEEDQDELKRRHNDTMEKKANVERAIEIDKVIEKSMVPEPNAVIQIKTEPNRGVLCQVGMVDGDVVHCYCLRPQGQTEYLYVKMGDFIVIAPVRTGCVALKYEYKPKEQAPNWHEEPNK